MHPLLAPATLLFFYIILVFNLHIITADDNMFPISLKLTPSNINFNTIISLDISTAEDRTLDPHGSIGPIAFGAIFGTPRFSSWFLPITIRPITQAQFPEITGLHNFNLPSPSNDSEPYFCMVYSPHDDKYENPQLGGLLTVAADDDKLIFTPLIPLRPNYAARCLLQTPRSGQQSDSFSFTTKESFARLSSPLSLRPYTTNPYSDVGVDLEYSATGLIHNGVREDLITITLTHLAPNIVMPFVLGFDRDSNLRYDRIFYLSAEESKIIANYWALLRPTTNSSSNEPIPEVQSVSCGRDVSVFFHDGFKIVVKGDPEEIAVCKIPVPIFELMQVMTGIPSLDYSMFNGRKIAVYMKLDDLRTVQGDTVSNSAIWDFTNKYMNDVSIKENHYLVYYNTDETDLQHNTVRLHYDIIITGKVPSFRVKKVHCDTNPPRDDKIRDDPTRIAFYDKLLDRDDGYLLHFQYNTSPIHTWLPNLYKSAHKQLYLDSDYKTAITENYNGYANVTIVFEIPIAELAYPFVIELEINDQSHFVNFLPVAQLSRKTTSYSDSQIKFSAKYKYFPYSTLMLRGIGKITKPEADFTFPLRDYTVAHSIALVSLAFFPFELRSVDLLDKMTCWQTFYDEHGNEVTPLLPFNARIVQNPEIAKVFSLDAAFSYEVRGAAWKRGWYLELRCTVEISPTVKKPKIGSVGVLVEAVTGFNQRRDSFEEYDTNPSGDRIEPVGEWTQFDYGSLELDLQVFTINPITSQSDLNSVLDTVVEILKSAVQMATSISPEQPSVFQKVQREHLRCLIDPWTLEESPSTWADSIAYPSHFYTSTTATRTFTNHIFSPFDHPGGAMLNLMAHIPDIVAKKYDNIEAFQEDLARHVFTARNGIYVAVAGGGGLEFPFGPTLSFEPTSDPPGFPLPLTALCLTESSCRGPCIEGRCGIGRFTPIRRPTVTISNYYFLSRASKLYHDLPAPKNLPVSNIYYSSRLPSEFTITDVELPGGIKLSTDGTPVWVVLVAVIAGVIAFSLLAYFSWICVFRRCSEKNRNQTVEPLLDDERLDISVRFEYQQSDEDESDGADTYGDDEDEDDEDEDDE